MSTNDVQRAFVEAAKVHVRAIHRPHERPDRQPVGPVLTIAANADERAHLALGMRLKAAPDVLTYVAAVDDVAYGYCYDGSYHLWTEALHAAVKQGDWEAMMREADALLSMINGANEVAYVVDFEARHAAFEAAGYEGDEGRDYDTPSMRYLASLQNG